MNKSWRWLLVGAILIHLTMLASWRTGFLNRLFFDATVTHGHRGWDLYALYQAGHNVLTGHSVYQSDGTQIDMVIPDGTYTPFRYLPVSAYTVGVLLNLVSPLWAYRLWVAWIELCLLGCIWLTWRDAPERQRVPLTAMWLCYTPFYLELYMGQFSFVQGTLVFAMLTAAPLFDGAWIASVLWKQNTILFAPLMVRLKRWKTLLLLSGLIALTAGPYFALVPGSLNAFLGNLRSDPPWFQFGNLGFRQLVFDAMWSAADTFKLGISPQVYAGVQRSVVALFLLIPLSLTVLDRRPDRTLHISLWITTYFMLYHHVWEHHYVMLLPVLVALTMRFRSRWLWIIYLLLALPTPYALIDPSGQVAVLDAMRWTPIRPLWQDLLYHASKAIPALLLYGWLCIRIICPIWADWRSGQRFLWPFSRAEESG
ncbi:MAG: hypothetical protein JW934_13090 [Anaerolineae bacterium]|nr:hypothetical protein [Anaerolineae bacterium]